MYGKCLLDSVMSVPFTAKLLLQRYHLVETILYLSELAWHCSRIFQAGCGQSEYQTFTRSVMSMWILFCHSFAEKPDFHLEAKSSCLTSHTACHIVSYHVISYHIISYHIISYHIISYHIISYHIKSHHIISYPITSYHIYVHPYGASRCIVNYVEQNHTSANSWAQKYAFHLLWNKLTHDVISKIRLL